MIETDALVIGAGPAGLFAVFQLGLQGLASQVVDTMDRPGGQCAALYPDKTIYDLPAIAACSGAELAQQLLAQTKPFAPGWHWCQQVSTLALQPDQRWLLSSQRLDSNQAEQQFLARSVFIAAGVGAFVARELKLEGLKAFLGRQLFYQQLPAPVPAASRILIVGGDEQALAQAVAITQTHPAAVVTLLHRRELLQASPATLLAFNALRDAGRIVFQPGQPSAIKTQQQRLTGLVVSTPEQQTLELALDVLLVCQGISPRLGPVAQWGLAMERKQLLVDSASLATSAQGIFAIGDIVSYPGKKKLIVCGFHEATLAAYAAAELLQPQAASALQYTSSSALLQQRLGVLPPS